jgi:hypothetical protein
MNTSTRSLVAAFGALIALPLLDAQTASETLSWFGQLGQGNAAVMRAAAPSQQDIRNNACVPTSVTNGLTFLQNYANFGLDEASPFTTSPNTYTQVNNLIVAMDTDADGTAYSDKYDGLQSHLSAAGANPAPNVRIFGQASPASKGGVPVVNAGIDLAGDNPTVGFLVYCLDNNDAVELGLQWGSYNSSNVFTSKGGHSVTLDSISYSALTNFGTLGFIDPWGSNAIVANAASSAGDYRVNFTIKNGFIYITLPTTVADGVPSQDVGLGTEAGTLLAAGQTARVLNDVVEALPDGGMTVMMMGAALVVLWPWPAGGRRGKADRRLNRESG